MASPRAQALKSLVESIHNNSTNNSVSDGAAPPPTYDETMNDADYDNVCPDGMNDDYVEPHFIQVDASTSVSGSGNVIHADFIASTGAKAAAAVCTFLKEQEKQRNQATPSYNHPSVAAAQGTFLRPRPVKIGLNISVRIAGGRNLIACPSSMRPPQSLPTSPTAAVPQPSSEEPRSQAGSYQAAEEAKSNTELNVSAQVPRSQSRPQQTATGRAFEEVDVQAPNIPDAADGAQSETTQAQESPAVDSDANVHATSSASAVRKRKADDEDSFDTFDDVDKDVSVEARKRSKVAEAPLDGSLGGAE